MSTRTKRDDANNRREDDSGGDERRQLLEDKPHDYIERTRPEDSLEGTSHHGQLTRDNINPNIPSAAPGTGEIVDPNTLGMAQDQQGVQPPPLQETLAEQKQLETAAQGKATGFEADPLQTPVSINEPPGSEIQPPPEPEEPPPEEPPPEEPPPEEPLPPEDELMALTRTQLDELAAERGVDITGCTTKAQVIERLQDDAEGE